MLLTVCMVLTGLTACADGTGEKDPATQPPETQALPADLTASEILCVYFSQIAKANPEADTEKLARLLSLHELFDNVPMNIYTQEWGGEQEVYLLNFPEDFRLTQCVRETTLMSMEPDSVLSGFIFELKENEDAGQFCELLKNSVVMPESTGEVECATAVEGNRVFFLLCPKELKDTLGSNPNRKETVNFLLRELMVRVNRSESVQNINTTDENSVYYTGITSTDRIEKEVAVAEPMIGWGFSVVLVKVRDEKDAQAVAQEMEKGLNPGKWICVHAESVKVTSCGRYVLGIMAGKDECESISEAFLEMLA